jgi:cellulose 1,4-beta-cellobiosidase
MILLLQQKQGNKRHLMTKLRLIKHHLGHIVIIGVFGILLSVGYINAVSDSTSEKFGTIQVKGGEYIVQNNIWGADTPQTVTVPDTNVCCFTVSLSGHIQDNVASYPSIYKGSHWGMTTSGWHSFRINELSHASFSWNVSSERPSGKYNIAAEAWFSPNLATSEGYSGGGELMIWLDSQGMVPAGSQVGTFGSYQVWYGQMSWNYICYYQTGENSVSVNLTDFINDAMSRGYLESSWYLHDIEAGFEICNGGESLTVNSFSVSVSGNESNTSESSTTPGFEGYLLFLGFITFLVVDFKRRR